MPSVQINAIIDSSRLRWRSRMARSILYIGVERLWSGRLSTQHAKAHVPGDPTEPSILNSRLRTFGYLLGLAGFFLYRDLNLAGDLAVQLDRDFEFTQGFQR